MPYPIPVKPEDLKWIYFHGEDAPPEGVPVGLWAAERSLATNSEALANVYKWHETMPSGTDMLDETFRKEWEKDYYVGALLDGWESDDPKWPKLSPEQFYAIIVTCLSKYAKDYDYRMDPAKIAELYHAYLTGERKATWKFPPDIRPEDVKWIFYRDGMEEPPDGLECPSWFYAEQSFARLCARDPNILVNDINNFRDVRSRILLAFEDERLYNIPDGVKYAAYHLDGAAGQGDGGFAFIDFLPKAG